MDRKSISVVMATFNGENYIKEQINSILNNLKAKDELIISDDGSTDNTINIIKDIVDDRIILVNGPKKGFNKNFENAIKYSHNDWIFFADQDDIWLDGKVDKCFENIDENVKCVRHNAFVVNEKLETINNSYFEIRKCNVSYLKNIYKNTFTGCCMCVERNWLLKLLPIPSGVFYDAWIGILSCKFNKAILDNRQLIFWRRHEGSVTNLTRDSFTIVLKNRIKLLKEIMKVRRKKL